MPEVRAASGAAVTSGSSAAPPRPAGAGWIVPADDRAALVPHSIGEGIPVPAQVSVRIGAAPAAASPVWWLSPVDSGGREPRERAGSPEARMSRWMGAPVAWSAVPASSLNGTAPSGGLALVPLPVGAGIGALGGHRVEIDGVSKPIRWLPAPSGVFDFAATTPVAGARARDNRYLRAALAGTSAQPWSAWRASLALRGGPTPLERAPEGNPIDSVAARLADQHAAIWSVAFQRLARADRDAARQLAIRLGGAVDFGGGVVAPVWINWPGPRIAGDGLELLLADLLADDLTDREKPARVRAWLQALPAAAAWVTDDAGLHHGLGDDAVPACSVLLVNLTEDPQAASVSLDGSATPMEMLTVRPMSAASVTVAPARSAREPGPSFPLDIRIGDWRGRATVLAAPVPAEPPGVPIGPLLSDLSMGQIAACAVSGQMPAVLEAAAGATVGMLHRRPADGSFDGDESGWVVYIEAMAPVDSTEADTVHVEFGPPGAPTAEWVVPREGPAVLHGARAGEVKRSIEPDRWRIWVPVPRSAIEHPARRTGDGSGAGGGSHAGRHTLRLGVVRIRQRPDGSSERSAWPRALAPWQDDCARFNIDLSTWSSGGTRP